MPINDVDNGHVLHFEHLYVPLIQLQNTSITDTAVRVWMITCQDWKVSLEEMGTEPRRGIYVKGS